MNNVLKVNIFVCFFVFSSAIILAQGTILKTENPISNPSSAQAITAPPATDLTYVQDQLTGNGTPNQIFEASFAVYDTEAADDFVIPPGGTRTIVSVQPDFTGTIAGDIIINVYDDAGGMPNNLLYSETFPPPNTNTGLLMPTSCPPLAPGTYWLALQVDQDFSGSGQTFWSTTTDSDAGPTDWVIRNPGDGFSSGCIDWCDGTSSTFAGSTGPGLAFTLNLSVAAAGVPTLSQWGLISLTLILFIFSVSFIRQSIIKVEPSIQ